MRYIKLFENHSDIDPFGVDSFDPFDEEDWEEADKDIYYIVGTDNHSKIKYLIVRKTGNEFSLLTFGDRNINYAGILKNNLKLGISNNVFNDIMNGDLRVLYFDEMKRSVNAGLTYLIRKYNIDVEPYIEEDREVVDDILCLYIENGNIKKEKGKIKNNSLFVGNDGKDFLFPRKKMDLFNSEIKKKRVGKLRFDNSSSKMIIDISDQFLNSPNRKLKKKKKPEKN
ncbi:MAG: hypothetical protein KDH96_09710, partial [Candidatus Riesia sp.]|nr:hypothetical protein [Candidatus Riesia sp.]